jgi:3'-5' exonuclease
MEIKKLVKNILFIDIETVSGEKSYEAINDRFKKLWDRKAAFLKNDANLTSAEQYFDRAAIYAEFGKIIVIGVGFFYWNEADQLCLKTKTFAGDKEKELLLAFNKLLDTNYSKKESALCAHNGKEFDYPYLCRRMLVNGIKLPKALDFSGKKPWEVPHFDTLEMWKFGDKKQFTSLEMLATLFGIESSKTTMSGDEVNSVYYHENNLEKIREYCHEDVIALAQIFLKLNGNNEVQDINIESLQ